MEIQIGRGKGAETITDGAGFAVQNGVATITRKDGRVVVTTGDVTIYLSAEEAQQIQKQQQGGKANGESNAD